MKSWFSNRWFIVSVIFFLLAGAAIFGVLKFLAPNNVQVFYDREKIKEKAGENFADGKQTVTISFFGDLMLDRSVRQHIEKKGIETFFSQDEDLYKNTDVNIANLEGPVADFSSKSVNTKIEDAGHFSFVFNPGNIPAFKQRNFSILHLGNNHILNFGQAGLKQTKDNLSANKIDYFGNPEDNNYFIYEKDGFKIGLVSYNQFRQGSGQTALDQLQQLKNQTDIMIVYAHWGEEYKLRPNETQQKLAHQLIDAGADAIIGSHPHVVQSVGLYQGKYIFYSLGNYIFDQFFSEKTKQGLAVVLQFDKKTRKISYALKPITINNSFEVSAGQGKTLQQQLENLAENSLVPNEQKEQIKKGIICSQ